jgi:tetraacyldisaccharide 4'-kinase
MQRLQSSWRRRGPLACALLPLAGLYGVARQLHALLHRFRRIERPPVPVIVVGNLIAGGAGKTPTVQVVVDLLRRHGWHPGIVSRGYGRRADRVALVHANHTPDDVGDEPLLLHLRGGVPVAVGSDRAAAVRVLLAAHAQIDVVVSDDGLQHRALACDIAVVVFDERGAGNGWLLPAGPLREPLPRAVGPNTLVLYNAAAPTTPLPGFMARRRLAGAVALKDWWRGDPPSTAQLDALRGRPLYAAAGTAVPERFFTMLRDAGLQYTALPLPDHHAYPSLPWPAGVDVVVTEKDAVKLRPDRAGTDRVWVVALDFEPEPAFAARLLQLLPPRPLAR